ncbi:MAG: transglutaminase domain-containing protein [Bacillota bacterium]
MGRLEYRPAGTYRLEWVYRNRHREPVQVWLALPPDLPTQKVLGLHLTPEPHERTVSPDGLGEMAWYRLAPGEAVRLDATIQTFSVRYSPRGRGPVVPLEPQERELYLRSTGMVTITPEIREEARRLTEGCGTDLEKVHRLAVHMFHHYGYCHPPRARGATAMGRDRRGDCGQFSALFAAWCRFLGIPTRVHLGTWAVGRFQGHAWTECYIEGLGWLPVDISVATVHSKLRRLLRLRHLPSYAFGHLEGQRITFSLKYDRELVPPYPETNPPLADLTMEMGEQPVAFGYQLLHRRAPYLQPAYVRLPEQVESLSRPLTVTDLLGDWRGRHEPWHLRALHAAQVFLFAMAGLAVLATLVPMTDRWLEQRGLKPPDLWMDAAFLAANGIAWFLSRGRSWLPGFLAVFFLFMVLEDLRGR